MDFPDYKSELKKREYTLKCKVLRKSVSYYDDAYEGNSHADLVMLEPYEGTERDMLMTCYYEDARAVKNGEGHLASRVELPAFIGSPCAMPSMVRLNWPNEVCEHPHFLVMSYSMESLLNSYKNIDVVEIKVFPYDKVDDLGLSNSTVRS